MNMLQMLLKWCRTSTCMSQELFDHMQDEEEHESGGRCEVVDEVLDDVDGWYDDTNAVDDNDGGNFINTTEDTVAMIEEEDKSFKAVYAESIAPVLRFADNLFQRSVWRYRPVVTHPPASDIEIA